jgi:hypothetical protein
VAHNQGIFQARTWAFDYDPVHSFYCGLSMPLELPVGSVTFDGSLTYPATWRVVETLGPVNATPDGYSRAWTFTDTMWFTAQGIYESPEYVGVSALAGFRWDRWDTALRDPHSPATNVGATSNELDEGSLTVDLYLPIIGLKMRMNGFSLGVLGAPVCSGETSQISLVNTTALHQGKGGLGSGYLLEIFGDYGVSGISDISGATEADLSLFWKINKLYAKGEMDGTGINNQSGSMQSSDTFTTIYDRWLFVVGAQINYTLPLTGLSNYVRWFW